jgi:LysR family transcriptional activator of nhaA
MEVEVKRQYGVHVVGRTDEIRARFYAISPERRLKNPAVSAICEAAREELFAST